MPEFHEENPTLVLQFTVHPDEAVDLITLFQVLATNWNVAEEGEVNVFATARNLGHAIGYLIDQMDFFIRFCEDCRIMDLKDFDTRYGLLQRVLDSRKTPPKIEAVKGEDDE